MQPRERFHWAVELQADNGTVSNVEIANYWSPTHPGTPTAIGEAAKAEAYMASGRARQYHAVKAERLAAPA